MGYRSDVRIVTTKDGYNKLNDLYKKNLEKTNIDNIYNLLDNLSLKCKTEDGNIYFGWNYIKWYYEDVDLFEKSLKELADLGYGYNYARIGEEYGDIDTTSYPNKNDEYIDDYPRIIRDFDDEEYINSKDSELEM